MRFVRGSALPALTIVALICSAPAALAVADLPGGTQAPSSPQAGGSEYGVLTPIAPPRRPVISALSVPPTAPAGRPPRVTLQIQEPGVGAVKLGVRVTSLSPRRSALVVNMGWVHTARTLVINWPVSAKLAPGGYEVRVSAHDRHGGTLLRKAHSSGVASLTVSAPPKPAPAPAPAPTPAPAAPAPAPAAEAGVLTPAQSAAAGAVFPVLGAHDFGGPENRFGAQREGHIHQGQDVLTSEGAPVVAPLAGTILTTSYQAGGAGYYAVEHTGVGFDFMFAHCQAGSLAVSANQAVSAGQELCKAGQTGDATTPHLHFEIWVGGWQASTGHPIDPLPYLEAWEQDAGG